MISKKVGMKTPEKSRFGKLVAYLLDPQGKKTRVGEVTITNCVSTDTTWAVREIAATQRLNARAKSGSHLSSADFAQSRRKSRCQNTTRDRRAFLQGAGLC
jgi:hypothetical protein